MTNVIVFAIIAFRGLSVGNDTMTYAGDFQSIASIPLKEIDISYLLTGRYEIGYILLNKIIYYQTNSVRILFVVGTLFFCLVLCMYLHKLSGDVFLSELLFLGMGSFAQAMNQFRIVIAMSFGMIALIKLIKGNNEVEFTAWIIIASLFQRTVLVLLILLFARFVQISWKSIVVVAAVIIISFAETSRIAVDVARIVPSYTEYLGSISETEGVKVAVIMNVIIMIILTLIFVLSYFTLPRLEQVNRKWAVYFLMLMSSLGFYILSVKFSQLSRLAFIFNFGYLVSIPDVLSQISSQKIRRVIVIGLSAVAIAFFFFVQIYRPEWYGIVPYTFGY
jgi:hypothetical protein